MYLYSFAKQLLGRGLGYSQKNWVRVCGPLPKLIALCKTKISDFPYTNVLDDLTKKYDASNYLRPQTSLHQYPVL